MDKSLASKVLWWIISVLTAVIVTTSGMLFTAQKEQNDKVNIKLDYVISQLNSDIVADTLQKIEVEQLRGEIHLIQKDHAKIWESIQGLYYPTGKRYATK